MGLAEQLKRAGVEPLAKKNVKPIKEPVFTEGPASSDEVGMIIEPAEQNAALESPAQKNNKKVQRWRAKNREHYLAKQREYQKAYRARQK